MRPALAVFAALALATSLHRGQTVSAQAPPPGRTPTVHCEAGLTYHDERNTDGWGAEYCARELGGHMSVKVGPYKFWESGKTNSEGAYRDGREVGTWKDCDRFGRCRTVDHDQMASPPRAGRREEVPVSFVDGRYRFDFQSCRTTWVDVDLPGRHWVLNIGDVRGRCSISIFPVDATWSKSEGASCQVPFQIGMGESPTIELWRAMPWFCELSPTFIDGKTDSPEWFRATAYGPLPPERAPVVKEELGWIAWSPDVTCAAIETPAGEPPQLRVRLNQYAEPTMAGHIAAGHEVQTRFCGVGAAAFTLTNVTMSGDDGHRVFSYALSRNASTARAQRACIARKVTLQPSCEAR